MAYCRGVWPTEVGSVLGGQAAQTTGWLHSVLKDSVAYWMGVSPTGSSLTTLQSTQATGMFCGLCRGTQPTHKVSGRIHDVHRALGVWLV